MERTVRLRSFCRRADWFWLRNFRWRLLYFGTAQYEWRRCCHLIFMFNVITFVIQLISKISFQNNSIGFETAYLNRSQLDLLIINHRFGLGSAWSKSSNIFSNKRLTMIFNSKIGNESDIQKFIFKVICSARVYFHLNTKRINQSDNLASKLGVLNKVFIPWNAKS